MAGAHNGVAPKCRLDPQVSHIPGDQGYHPVARPLGRVWQHWTVATFAKDGRSHRDRELDTLREATRNRDRFWYSMPSSWESGQSGLFPVMTFDERRQEFDKLGFDCVEIHRGFEKELFEAGKIHGYDHDNKEVIVARFVRRSEVPDHPT